MAESKRKPQTPDSLVTLEECRLKHGDLQKRVDKIELALFGEDGRGGMVADVRDIKSATSFLKSILVPVISAVIAACITAAILGWH